MSEEDELLEALEAEEKLRQPVVFAKEFKFAVDEEEEKALRADNDKRWTIMQGVIAKRGGYDLDLFNGQIMFALTCDHESLLDEITHGINEQLDEITGRRLKDTEAWGMF